MKPVDRLIFARTVISDLIALWPTYAKNIRELSEPSMGGGDGGRASGVSDPTGRAVIAGEPWTQHQREAEALLTELLGNARGIERHLWQVTAEANKPSKTEKKTMQCSGEHDPLCERDAAVPSKRGMCDAGYLAWWRAQKKASNIT